MSTKESENAPYSPRTGGADDTISLLDLIEVVAKRKWLIVGVTAASALLVLLLLVISMFLPATSPLNFFPEKYRPTATILLQMPQDSSASISSLFGQSGLGALSGLVGDGGKLGGTNADLVTALLRTNSIVDKVAEKLQFVSRYKIEKNPRTNTRLIITKSLIIENDDKSGMMRISYEDTDKVFATDVLNMLVDLVGKEFTNLSVSRILEKEDMLKAQLDSAEGETVRLQAALTAFQGKYGIYDIGAQAAANNQAIGALRAQVVSNQISLQLQSKSLPPTDYRIVQLRDQISETEKAIQRMTEGSGDQQSGVVPQKQLQSLSGQYQKIVRDITVQQTIAGSIKSQYEAARLDELTRAQAFQVVEAAEVPEMRSSPRRARIAVITTVVMGFVSVLIAFIAEYFERAKQDPAEARKLQVIKDSFSLRRRPR